MNFKKGISLITLTITIIIILILAGMIILVIANNATIDKALDARFIGDVRSFQTELELYKVGKFLDRLGNYNEKLLQSDEVSVTYGDIYDTSINMYDLIPSLR